jgi:hypothetical protein
MAKKNFKWFTHCAEEINLKNRAITSFKLTMHAQKNLDVHGQLSINQLIIKALQKIYSQPLVDQQMTCA